jgi:hypothetical protein
MVYSRTWGIARDREDLQEPTTAQPLRPSVEEVMARYESDPDHERLVREEHCSSWRDGFVKAFEVLGDATAMDIHRVLTGSPWEMSTNAVKSHLQKLFDGRSEIHGYKVTRKSIGGLEKHERVWVYSIEKL